MVNLGLNVLSLRSAHSHADRRETIRLFNDPTSPVDVLVTNFRTSSLGVNLQGCCCNTIILDTAANVNTIIQTIGRIHRLGQKEVQDIYIITVDHTYDQVLQAKATNKMIAQLSGEARIKGNSQEEMEANAEELITKILGQRCSRKDWGGLDLKVKDQLKQAPFRTQEQVAREREERDKLQRRAEAGVVSGRTRGTRTAVADAKETANSADPDLLVGNGGNDDVGEIRCGKPNNCSHQHSLLLICHVVAVSPEEQLQSELYLNGEPGQEDISSPPTGQEDNMTATDAAPSLDGPPLTSTSDNCSYQRPLLIARPGTPQKEISIAPSSDPLIGGPPQPSTSCNCSYLGLPLLMDRVGPDTEDDQDPSSPLTAPPSSAEKSDGKGQAKKGQGKVKEKAKGKKRKAVDTQTPDDSEHDAQRTRRRRTQVDYKEKGVDDL